MSASGEIVRRLLARGLTGQQIGQAIGRDRSLVSQVGRDVKPGANLETALAELERRAAAHEPLGGVAPPARRTTSAGRAARVRRPTTVGKGNWRTSTVKRQAAGSGGKSLGKSIEQAAADGSDVAATITYDKSVHVSGTYGKGKRGKSGAGGSVELRFDPDDYAEALFNGDVLTAVDWLNSLAAAEGYVPSGVQAGQVESVELRVF